MQSLVNQPEQDQSINHLLVKASKMTVTKESVQDQQGSESAYSDPKTLKDLNVYGQQPHCHFDCCRQ